MQYLNLKSLLKLPYHLVRYHPLRGGWLGDHLLRHRRFSQRAIGPNVPIDVMVLIVDHFEPGERHGDAVAVREVGTWCEAHEAIADRHRDFDGRMPQHTWFYRAEYKNLGCIQELASSCLRGFGEVEFHLHHGNDTHETFAAKLREGVAFFNQAGAMLSLEATPRRSFAYIAGNWALCNGRADAQLSGCNTELLALREQGCYADFTFPALGQHSQPRKANAIYYGTNSMAPKPYDMGVDVAVGKMASGDLMLVQGPLVIDWRNLSFDDGAVENYAQPHPNRLDNWLKANVHVQGRPEWIFIKLHCHGMQSRAVFGSAELDQLFAKMTHRWNAPPFRLHFVTAREAYNIVKAAEAGKSGNPNDYRNFEIPPPANRKICADVAWELISYRDDLIKIKVISPGPASFEFAGLPIQKVSGNLEQLEIHMPSQDDLDIRAAGIGMVDVVTVQGTRTVPAQDVATLMRAAGKTSAFET